MRGAVLHAAGDVRVEERDRPTIVEPTDAIIRVSETCVCGSDLWPYRGVEPVDDPQPLGHEYVGVVVEVGDGVASVAPGQFVVGSFVASDNSCGICRAGYRSSCVNAVFMDGIGTQAELVRVPLADGTLVATPGMPPDDLVPSLLAASDVLGTGWLAARAAQVRSRHDGRRAAGPGGAPLRSAEPQDRSRQGARPEPSARSGCRGLPGDGRAPCDQDSPHHLMFSDARTTS